MTSNSTALLSETRMTNLLTRKLSLVKARASQNSIKRKRTRRTPMTIPFSTEEKLSMKFPDRFPWTRLGRLWLRGLTTLLHTSNSAFQETQTSPKKQRLWWPELKWPTLLPGLERMRSIRLECQRTLILNFRLSKWDRKKRVIYSIKWWTLRRESRLR